MSFNPKAPKTGMTPSSGNGNPPSTAQVVASAIVPTTIAAQAALVRHVGQAQAAGFRPSLVSLLFNARSYMAAPMPVKLGTAALIATSTAVKKASGIGPKELVDYGMSHFCRPVEDFFKRFPPGGGDGDDGGITG